MKTARTEGPYVAIDGQLYQEIVGVRYGVEVERYFLNRNRPAPLAFPTMEEALEWLAKREGT
jgi:hypothetical protein